MYFCGCCNCQFVVRPYLIVMMMMVAWLIRFDDIANDVIAILNHFHTKKCDLNCQRVHKSEFLLGLAFFFGVILDLLSHSWLLGLIFWLVASFVSFYFCARTPIHTTSQNWLLHTPRYLDCGQKWEKMNCSPYFQQQQIIWHTACRLPFFHIDMS